MTSIPNPFRESQEDESVPSLPSCSSILERLGERFDACGSLGLVIVDASFLEVIERRNGDQARRSALKALGNLVQKVTERTLKESDLVMNGEAGRNEIWVVFLREGEDAALVRQEIPNFEVALKRLIEQNAGKAFYPHLRQAPSVAIGSEVCLRNPRFSTETQIIRAAELARRDLQLSLQVEDRERRRRFREMLFERRIYSVYEPIVEVNNRVVFGYEALVRGPEKSEFMTPLTLFGAAEQYDMVYELDCLCRSSGLSGAIDFPEGTKLFLNILPTAFHDPNFRAERLIKTLEKCELSPTDVVFEISEQESIENFSVFKEARDNLRALGFQFALDDMGSGYAGLEALLEISPEYIKMDRAFVTGVDEDSARQDLLSTLLTLAEKMGSKVIGEGLDTIEELEMLGKLGIHFGQGWLFGHATPLRARD
ncbi:MAG: EAL domain-containing protein [Myxococcales bacterium]|nr:EAL domain-containing protein [Myxococcales bacterium]